MKIVFVCALFLEAKPLIQKFALKKVENLKSFQVFENTEISLIVTGTGKINVAVGLSLLLPNFPDSQFCLINFGICGCAKQKIGKIFLINKISDTNTERDFYPDNLLKSSFSQKSLITVSKPLLVKNQTSEFQDNLIDMEGSAFFETASFFANTEQIFLLKMVSDNLNQKILNQTEIANLLQKQINFIAEFVDLIKLNYQTNSQKQVLKIPLKIHLTTTQKVKLKNKLHDLSVQKGEQGIFDFWKNVEKKIDPKKNPKENGKIVFDFLNQFWRESFF